MERRKSTLALAAIGVGIIILFGQWIGFLSVVALILMLAGVYKIRNFKIRKGYTMLAIGAGLLVLDHLFLFVVITLASLAAFYSRSRKLHKGQSSIFKHNFISNYKWDEVPWILRSTSIWHVVGDVDADLTLAIPEEREPVVFLQGIFGDIDITLPDNYGVEVEMFVLFGQIQFDRDHEAGILNRLVWKSPNYAQSEYKVKFVVSYLAGDVRVRFY